MSAADQIVLYPEFISLNGTTRAKITARDKDGQIIDSEVLNLEGSTMRERFARRLARACGEDNNDGVIEEFIRKILSLIDQRPKDIPATEAPPEPSAAELLAEMPEEIRIEADELLRDPNLLKRTMDHIEEMGVAGERVLVAQIEIAITSRHLAKPVSVIVTGLSSTGKSHATERVAELHPPEGIIHANQMTPQALFHLPKGALSHRAIIGGERSRLENDDTAEATRALREMISSGKLSKLMPTKGPNGEIVTILIEQDGPIVYIESTTLAKIFDEDANRCLLLSTDERAEQTRKILRATAAGRMKPADLAARRHHIVQVHHAAQRIIATHVAPVVVPFAAILVEKFPDERPEARRAFGHLLTCVESCALLHCLQRKRDGDGAIVAALDDYHVARCLLAVPLARALGASVSQGAKRFRDRLYKWVKGNFTTTEAVRHEKVSDRAVRGWLRELCAGGWVEPVEGGRGHKPSTWRVPTILPTEADAIGLPTVADVEQAMAGTAGSAAGTAGTAGKNS